MSVGDGGGRIFQHMDEHGRIPEEEACCSEKQQGGDCDLGHSDGECQGQGQSGDEGTVIGACHPGARGFQAASALESGGKPLKKWPQKVPVWPGVAR